MLLICLIAVSVAAQGFNNDVATLYRHMQSATDQGESFPSWDPKEIDGWDQMTPDDQKQIKEFYDSFKKLYENLSALDRIE